MNPPSRWGRTISKDLVSIAALSDVHCREDSKRVLRPVFEQIADKADILLVCGDITHLGLPEEADVFIEEAEPVLNKIPVLGVLGNHDFESGKQDMLWEQFSDAGMFMMNGNIVQIHGISFTGIKGFGGGFGGLALQPWGEPVIKDFVKEVGLEAQKLEAGLSKLDLDSGPRIVVMHYSPVRETLTGEPPEIFPFLGSSNLEGPIDRHSVTAVFHGHAHRGRLDGKTNGNVPVYNVSMPVLKQRFADRAPFFLLEVPVQS
jgi:Icc-related predicted phosphoesterase